MTETPEKAAPALWKRLAPWVITAICFAYLYLQIDRQAGFQGKSAFELLGDVFAQVSWFKWLALMIPYSIFFFLIDSLVVWRIINWFNTRIPYTDILPIRASAYIISILNEQVGKGAMAMYLNRRDGVPGLQVLSSMMFIMFCEFYYLLGWATVGTHIGRDALPEIFHSIPLIAAVAFLWLVLWILYFRGTIAPGNQFRNRDVMHAFRQARWWQYGTIILLRSPALLAAVVVYTLALRLFGVEATFANMLGYLPVIFFGASIPGPFRAVAITLWSELFPENRAQMAIFGLVQHNFFILFNAAIGLAFVRRANRELFES